MGSDVDKTTFDRLLQNYFSLAESAATLARSLKNTPNANIRTKLLAELRTLDRKRLELLEQMGN